MSKRAELERSVQKSTTNADETRFLLSAIDSCIAEELDKSDSLLLDEIEELEIKIKVLKLEVDVQKSLNDKLSVQMINAQIEKNKLAEAFNLDPSELENE